MTTSNTTRTVVTGAAFCALILAASTGAFAHFQVLVPSTDIVTADGDRATAMEILFTHPMENGPAMEMGAPRRFGVLVDGETKDLLPTLKAKTVQGKAAYETTYAYKTPMDHVFFLEPAPYWEPAEGKMIIHYTKVIVSSMGSAEGWDALVGLPVEIEPLARPYSLYAGNVFQGVVRKNGKPAPFAEVEVEYLNRDGRYSAPADVYVTQVLKADANGVFTYAMPKAGWWGFAALVDGDEKMTNPEGKQVDVELGGLIWVRCVEMK